MPRLASGSLSLQRPRRLSPRPQLPVVGTMSSDPVPFGLIRKPGCYAPGRAGAMLTFQAPLEGPACGDGCSCKTEFEGFPEDPSPPIPGLEPRLRGNRGKWVEPQPWAWNSGLAQVTPPLWPVQSGRARRPGPAAEVPGPPPPAGLTWPPGVLPTFLAAVTAWPRASTSPVGPSWVSPLKTIY